MTSKPDTTDQLSRRQLFRRTAATTIGASATVAVGSRAFPRYSPVGRAQAAAPLAPIGIIGGAAAVKYLTGKSVGEHAIDLFTGDGRDYSSYTGADALREQIYIGGVEMLSADERVMTSIENNISNSQNVALAKSKNEVISVMNNEGSESEANSAMEAAANAYYSVIQENVLTHYDQQMRQFDHHLEQLASHDEASTSDVISIWDGTNNEWTSASSISLDTTTVDLFDGRSVEVAGYDNGDLGNAAPDLLWPPAHFNDDAMGEGSQPPIRYSDPSSDETHGYGLGRFVAAFDAIAAERDDTIAQLSTFVEDVYAQYEPGDIPTEDLVDPITASTELRQNYDNMAGAGAHASMLGIPTSAEFSALLHIYSDELEGEEEGEDYYDVWADIFTSHIPTDSDGNEVGFEVGATYNPSEWDEPLYIAYEYVDDQTGEERGDFTQIESEFTIELVEDADGNEVETFQTRSRNNQTADVAELKKELEQLREEQIAMQEEAQGDDGDGGFTFPWKSDELGGGTIALAAGALAFVFAFAQTSNN